VFGSGEGKAPYASVQVTLGADGTGEFRGPLKGNGLITATATVDGSTSEFSR